MSFILITFFSFFSHLATENVRPTIVSKMQNLASTLGNLRAAIFSRSLISVVDRGFDTNSYKYNHSKAETGGEDDSHPQLTTAVSGFPKAKNGQYNIDNILKGQIGDDAYFIARHVDDWNNNTETPGQILNPSDEKNHEQITQQQQQQQQHRQRRTSADVIGKKFLKVKKSKVPFNR